MNEIVSLELRLVTFQIISKSARSGSNLVGISCLVVYVSLSLVGLEKGYPKIKVIDQASTGDTDGLKQTSNHQVPWLLTP